jgi:phosphoesterase RecJ-like protein
MPEEPPDFAPFISLVSEHSSFVITTHVNPDGDALGSEIGLAEWLLSLGKAVRIFNHSKTPQNYHFLDTPNPIVEQFDAEKHASIIQASDVLVVLDVNDPERTKSLGPHLLAAKQPIAVIDHHLNPKMFATDYFVDTEACSTGEMIMRLVQQAQPTLGGTISKKGANALYVAIMTDTGNFRFPRTDSEIFRMCADLLDLGADPVTTYNEVYNTSPAGRLLLVRDALTSLEYHYDGLMAFQCIRQSDLRAANAEEEDVDGFVQMPFQVKGIMLSIFLLELKEGWKISTRSKEHVSAALFSQQFGGNGHFHAAGARVYEVKSFEEMHQAIIDNAGKVLATANALTPQAA